MRMVLTRSERRLLLLELLYPLVLLAMGVYGGLMQTLMRAGIVQRDPFLGPNYYQGLTLHGVFNAIVFTTFFAVAFGNALIPYALGKRLKLRWAWLSALLMVLGSLMAAAAIFAGRASVLYTFYPPLKAHPAFYLGLTLLVVGSWVAFFNWIPLYLGWRRENPDQKTPLAVVGMLATFIVWLIATSAVAVEILFLLLPWSLGWTQEVNVMLARTLFWFFGHPLVYFWLLPAYVMYYTMLPKLAGGKLYSDAAGRLVFLLFIVFSIPVGTHHQYMDPAIGANWKLLHAFFTFAVALPSLITAFSVAASLEYAGRLRGARGLFGWLWKQPYFSRKQWLFSYLIAGLVIFIFGGISGIINASYGMNAAVHNTSWVPGHFHMTVAGPVLLAFLGMSLYLLGQASGKEVRFTGLAVAAPWTWLVGVLLFSFAMSRGGLLGMPRRTNMGVTYLNPSSPFYREDWVLWADMAVVGGVIMTLAFVLYLISFLGTLMARPAAEPALVFPLAEAYHDEPVRALANFRPWIVAALILIVIAYTPVIWDVLRSTYENAPPYLPGSPLPVQPTGR
ncbi:MAG: cbb3-type cytochrome c oxidase subunit I [Bacteroidetes bacterium]|nr:cbb3-type cytochrome c oxidase subunit I [Bacteroidota bacterium]MCX7907448.1 cbb3-type cytochrome c oxidase subunit I [Bacteroidota bacterium]MDW8138442.1 cbb3-type cytochrome c oxidase subunit I [Bacteroidota bacterium]